jgi:non-ribosomal peptide synthetase-like protein
VTPGNVAMPQPRTRRCDVTDPLRRGDLCPDQRTLLDIFDATVQSHPTAPALDDGTTVLSYESLAEAVQRAAATLRVAGIGRGDRVGVRVPSGTHRLYISILGVLLAGAAYVPVDADDPQERADLVFGEAGAAAVLDSSGLVMRRVTAPSAADGANDPGEQGSPPGPGLEDDAWIIFTSGSTGTPKGVAVTHRSAAAFVDAESRLFLRPAPIGPGDRVLAGLSVAFDASCEEMWLAWRYGACLVPAPRALVRSGIDLGPWLVAQRITVVSTVPTLASLWPAEALDGIRLLIFGGESCPPELAARLATPDRELWNTYGPTEATVVACAARLDGTGPVRIGLPLDGWDLAVVDAAGTPVPDGETGELIIGGVGLARYLDPAKDAEKYAPMPTLGWARAYRSGDLVRHEAAGLVFVGRGDDQVKLGGRRIELGEVDAALQALPGVAAAAAAVRTTAAGNQLLVGYLALGDGADAARFDQAVALQRLRETLPAALVPRLAVLDALPTRTSGKIDRDALPWPLSGLAAETGPTADLHGTAAFLAQQWTRILGASITGLDDDFFAHGGGSLSAAQLVSTLRGQFPEVTVADVYETPRLGALADRLDEFTPTTSAENRTVAGVPFGMQVWQTVLAIPLATLVGLRWLTWLALATDLLGWWRDGSPGGSPGWAPHADWRWIALGWLLLVTPLGRLGLSAVGARLLLRGVRPGAYPRGGWVHRRLWLAESLAVALGAENLAGAPWIASYARALGCSVGRDVDLHAVPPVTGLLTLGRGCAVEPEVDLSGHWLDGDVLRLGRIRIGTGATIGARSTLAPGSRIGQESQVAAGSSVFGPVPPGELWAGSPAVFTGPARHDWPDRPAVSGVRDRFWVLWYGLSASVLAALPLVAAFAGLAVIGRAVQDEYRIRTVLLTALAWTPAATVVALVSYAALVAVSVRLLSRGIVPGQHRVRSRVGWQVWATERLMDDARTWLFPLYASLFTPIWLRLLGATVGRDVEASTVLMIPSLTTVGDSAFLADDTMVGSYELGQGWLRVEPAKIGKRSFLGNSGMIAPGRRIPKDSLVAVLSATPERAKRGTSWVGSPPVQMRRTATESDASRTFAPPLRLKLARAAVELLRAIPAMAGFAVAVLLLLSLQYLANRFSGGVGLVGVPLPAGVVADQIAVGTGARGSAAVGYLVAGLLSGVLVLGAAILAAALATTAKWMLVGRIRATEYPLWSSFVWRNELADTFVELVAAPWFARSALGSPALNLWLRSLGARIGRGAWCETYWLPEADLVRLGDASTVNRGCVVQTHLFHDRILQMDTVTLDAGATLGPHSVVLPAARIGESATVGPVSLVMRGEAVPEHTRWTGNPIAFWPEPVPVAPAVRP